MASSDIDITSIIALIVAFLSFIPSVLSVIKQMKFDKAAIAKTKEEERKIAEEADEITVNTALSLITPLRKRISELEEELRNVMKELKDIEILLEEKDKEIEALKCREIKYLKTIEKLEEEIRRLKGS